MNKILEKADELRDEILSRSEVQEYLKIKKLIKNNEELQGFRKEIARLTNENMLKERDELIKIYESHPLVSNYYNLKEEVKVLLNTIKDILK